MGYNIGAQYEIIGRITEKTTVTHYALRDRNTGQFITLQKGIVEQLALNRQIYNCNAQIYENLVNLRGIGCKLNQLPKYDLQGNLVVDKPKQKRKVQADLEIIGKKQKGRNINTYIVRSLYNNNIAEVPRSTVIKLAQLNRIHNVKVQQNEGIPMLRGINGFNLSNLKNYNSEE